ncbi:DUF2889 domain-containing protein [Streptomyces sp. NPDC058247]|uniref:DUF2889 domain-containing protein n=1 Tax=Streptomyces sp. NPDC058247 TaxID=3346401 RepID=UPI0036EEEA9D
MLRPQGPTGGLVLEGRARDLRTAADGTATVLAEATTSLEVAYLDGRRTTAVRSTPGHLALGSLIGVPAAGGFRKRLDELMPDERDARSLLHLLLDDVPGTALVSGYAVGAAGVTGLPRRTGHVFAADQCAGFRSGGTIMVDVVARGEPPVVTGPAAPSLSAPEDPLAWHPLPAVPSHGMRRVRRLDVVPGEGTLTVESFFRDSHVDPDGVETVIHEYELHARVETGTWTVVEAKATPRVLPWLECPTAAASAQRLAGRRVSDTRREVRRDFRGTATCTHLNDQMRMLADVEVMAGLIAG